MIFSADSRLWLWLARLVRKCRPRRRVDITVSHDGKAYYRDRSGVLRRVDKIVKARKKAAAARARQ